MLPKLASSLCCLVFCLPMSALTAQSAWTQVTTSPSPSRGLWPGMAFATVTGKCYLYGGAGAGVTSSETWEYDGTSWTQLFPPTNPGERHTFGICYDENRSVIVELSSLPAWLWFMTRPPRRSSRGRTPRIWPRCARGLRACARTATPDGATDRPRSGSARGACA